MSVRRIRAAAAGNLAVPVAAASLMLAPVGCGRGRPAAAALPPADATYTTRGRIESLPTTPGGGLRIHHEAIPDFKAKSGSVVGMGSMTMPFIPAEGLDLSSLAPGDQVSFTWELRWNARPNSRIVSIEKLAPGVTLNFGAPPEPAPSK
jgi:hypothetical protein